MHGINAQFPFFYFFFFYFIFYFLDKHVFNNNLKKTQKTKNQNQTNRKPGNNEWANPGLDGNCWENMPIIGRELNGDKLYHV